VAIAYCLLEAIQNMHYRDKLVNSMPPDLVSEFGQSRQGADEDGLGSETG